MRRNASILVIDDEEIMRDILQTLLEREGYSVRLATNGSDGLDLARSLPFDAVIVDVMMPGIDGLQVLEELRKQDEELPVIMITAYASVENAIAAMKRGAFDYITKPFKNDEVLVVLRNAIERRRLMAENTALRQNLQAQYHKFSGIIGRSPRMKQVFDLIIQAAPSRSTILITGESGTGKELVARAIHTNSPRADRAFVTVNSGNLPPLRERKEDIPLLAQHFLEKYGRENNRAGLELTPDALDLMMDYDWPGNVRELENVIERAVVLTSGPRIGSDLIPDHVRKAPTFQIPQFVVPPEGISFKEVITDFEKRLIES